MICLFFLSIFYHLCPNLIYSEHKLHKFSTWTRLNISYEKTNRSIQRCSENVAFPIHFHQDHL